MAIDKSGRIWGQVQEIQSTDVPYYKSIQNGYINADGRFSPISGAGFDTPVEKGVINSGSIYKVNYRTPGPLPSIPSLPAPSSPSFTPESISDLKVLLEADSLNLSDNDPVSSWISTTSAGTMDLRSGSISNRPLYRTNRSSTGKPSIYFDDSNDYIQADGSTNNVILMSRLADPGITFFAVYRYINFGGVVIDGRTPGTGLRGWSYSVNSSQATWRTETEPPGNFSVSHASGSIYRAIGTSQRSGGVITNRLYLNGSLVSSDSATGGYSQYNGTPNFRIGYSLVDTSAWNGDIFCIGKYDKPLSLSEIESLDDYLLAKWGT